jgi:hypothetical protein
MASAESALAIDENARAAAAVNDSAGIRHPLFHRLWPAAVVVLGVAMTAAWTALLGYGIVSLINFTL